MRASDPAWMAAMDPRCPFCGGAIRLQAGIAERNAGSASCECGYTATFTLPREFRDMRFGMAVLRLDD